MPKPPEPKQEIIAGLNVSWSSHKGVTQPVLFQHCTLATSNAWGRVMQELGPDVTFVSSDLPGHGGTGFDPARSFQVQATEIVAELIARIEQPVHFVGHSFGATVGLRLAREHPELIRTMTLYEPVLFGLLQDAADPEWDREIAEQKKFIAAMDQGPEAGAKEFFRRWGGSSWDDTPDRVRANVVERVKFAALSEPDLFGPPPHRVSIADIAAMTHPATILAGSDTPATARAIANVIAERMPNATELILDGAGHMGPLTHPAPLATAIRAQLG